MRAILTVLGVMIGVAAVITAVSIVQGFQYQISKQLENVGTTFIRVIPDFSRTQRNPFIPVPTLTYDDAVAVRRGATAIRDFTPLFITNVSLKSGDAHHDTTMLAANSSYQEVANQWVDHGRFFTPLDEEAKKRVVVVGTEVVHSLNLDDPIGKSIVIGNTNFTVVGVMEKRGAAIGNDPDDIVYIPFSTAQVLYGPDQMTHLPLALQVRSRDEIDFAKDEVRQILRARHHLKKGEPDDFQISTQEELAKTISSILLSVTGILALIVGIALVVGGIGIMNIMLVSVTERTREIGVRKSIGARRRDVLVQFLIEAISLSGLGGVIGIIGGYLFANGLRVLFRVAWKIELPPIHTPIWAIALAFTFCASLGVLFGIYPAWKASKLDPIEALRYE